MYKVFDLHNDYFLKLRSNSKKDRYISKCSQNDGEIISAVWTSELSSEESLYEIEQARDYVNSHTNLMLGVEDLHFLSKENLNKFISLRPVYAGLTWNTCNCIAGGAHESGKLTGFGRATVKALENNNIKIDTAHLNEDSFMDISKCTAKPLFCSHTAFYGIQPNRRNLKDYQLKMIVDSGGLVGLCLVSDFLCGSKFGTVHDIVAHIDYFACKFGINNLALGTDFYGTSHLPKSVKTYQSLIEKLSNSLKGLGYTEKSISRIFYENARDFFSA